MSDRGHLCLRCGDVVRNSGIVCSVYCTCNLRKQRDDLESEIRSFREILTKAHTILGSREGESLLGACQERMQELSTLRKKVKEMGDGVSRDCECPTCVHRREQFKEEKTRLQDGKKKEDLAVETFAVRWMGETLDTPNMADFEAGLNALVESERERAIHEFKESLAPKSQEAAHAEWKDLVVREALRLRASWGALSTDDIEALGEDENVVKLLRVIDRFKTLRKPMMG